MGGLDSAAAAVTSAARLVADAYMAAPADVAAAPATAATAVGPVSYVVWTCFVPLLWICLNLICMNLYELDQYLWLSMNETRLYLYVCIKCL